MSDTMVNELEMDDFLNGLETFGEQAWDATVKPPKPSASGERTQLRIDRCLAMLTVSSRARSLMHPFLFQSTSDFCQLSMLQFGRHYLPIRHNKSKGMDQCRQRTMSARHLCA